MPERAVYGTREDWLEVLAAIEAEAPLKYIALGVYPTPDVPVFRSGDMIVGLGEAGDGEKVAGPSFMVISGRSR